MTKQTAPRGLGAGGRVLWRGITEAQELDVGQLATLEAACRQRDRADSLAKSATTGEVSALRHEREASLAMVRLLTALRLPDPRTGSRSQLRSIRGVHQSPQKVGSLERARRGAEGA